MSNQQTTDVQKNSRVILGPILSVGTTPVEILKWVRDELCALCEATESDPTLVRSSNDHEGKVGAYARGRLREAKGFRRLGDVLAEKLRTMSDER